MDWSVADNWYDVMNPWGKSDDFYLGLVMQAPDALDIGCGTGAILKRARATGHKGRLCGVDPDLGMLNQARNEPAVEWHHCDAASMPFSAAFDVAIMSGHAFQYLLDDEAVVASITRIHEALRPGGQFAFETRNPHSREWEKWPGTSEVANSDGETAVLSYAVHELTGDVVRLTETLTGKWWNEPQVSEGGLRFIEPPHLRELLASVGFTIEREFGEWAGSPFDASSSELITLARA